jgi:hypothetical protein
MKKWIFISMLSIAFVNVKAQSTIDFGVNWAMNWNRMHESKRFSALNFDLYFDLNPNYVENEHWSFTTGLSLHQKKASMNDAIFDNMDDLRFNYLEIPLMVNYRIPVPILNVYVSGGGYGAYAVHGTSTFENEKVNIFKDDYTNIFNRYDAGLKFSVALGVPYSKTGLSVDYEYGLVDIIRNNTGKKATHGTLFLTLKVIGIVGSQWGIVF